MLHSPGSSAFARNSRVGSSASMSKAFLTGKGCKTSCVEEVINRSTAPSIEISRGPIAASMPNFSARRKLFSVRCTSRQNRVFFFLLHRVRRERQRPYDFAPTSAPPASVARLFPDLLVTRSESHVTAFFPTHSQCYSLA